ncbi:MAG: rod shape-determining protein [Candidatus Parcubacteria bacterium]|nr:MAG: rod shape-determining protein [Candidatus Parcubacteria bacterium]
MLQALKQWVAPRLGIDLGTTTTLVYVPGKGVVVHEPSVVALHEKERKVLAVGNEAREMLGKTPEDVVAYLPMREGVIADYRIAQVMLATYVRRALGSAAFIKPEVVVSVPAGVTTTQRRAVVEVVQQAGARAAYVVREPILAALGAGIPIHEPRGYIVADIGGGTIDVAVISLGGVVGAHSVKVGGVKLDTAITEYVRKQHNLIIGQRMAEEIKMTIGTALPLKKDETMEVRGRDVVSGMPRAIDLSANEVAGALQRDLLAMVRAVRDVLNDTPPELASDIIDHGIALTGGTAQLRNLAELLTRRIGVRTYVVDEPQQAVARGCGVILQHLGTYKRLFATKPGVSLGV